MANFAFSANYVSGLKAYIEKKCRPAPAVPTGLGSNRQIFRSILPKVVINRVVLELKSDQKGLSGRADEFLFDRNPHIDIEKLTAADAATNFEITDRTQFFQDLVSNRSSEILTVKVNFEIKQPLTNNQFSLLNNDKIRKALQIKVMLVSNNFDDYDALSRDGATFIPSSDTKQRTISWSSVVEPIVPDNSKPTFTRVEDGGQVVEIYPFQQTFELGTEEINSLGLIAYSYLDVGALNENFDLNLTTETQVPGVVVQPAPSESPKTSLLILDEGVVSSTTKVYVLPNGAVWDGPAHQMENGRWMTGITHDESSQFLSEKTVQTSKVQDFRISRVIENIPLDFDIINSDIFPNLEKGLYQSEGRIDINKTKNYFSDIFLSRDEFDQSRFFFSMNWKSILLDNSIYGKLFKDDATITELLRQAEIKSLRVSRIRVEGSSETGSRPLHISERDYFLQTKPKKFDPNEMPEILFETKDEDNEVKRVGIVNPMTDHQRDNSFFGELTQIVNEDLRLNGQIRSFSGVDTKIADVTDGYYQYKVELEILDSSIEVIKRKYNNLLDSIEVMKRYYDAATSLEVDQEDLPPPPNYSPYIDDDGETQEYQPGNVKYGSFNSKTQSFSQSFIDRWSSQGFFGPITEAINNFVDIIRFFSSQDTVVIIDTIKSSLIDYVNPTIATPQSIDTVIKTMQTVSSKIEDMVNVVTKGVTVYPQGDIRNPPLGGGGPKTFTIEKTFSEIYDAGQPAGLGFDFLGITTPNSYDSELGLKRISKNFFNSRTAIEKDMLWTGESGITSIRTGATTERIDLEPILTTNDINFTNGTYFTPLNILMPNESFDKDLPSEYIKPVSYSVLGRRSDNVRLYSDNQQTFSLGDRRGARLRSAGPAGPKETFANDLASYFASNHSLVIETSENQQTDSNTATEQQTSDVVFPTVQLRPQRNKQVYSAYDVLFKIISETTRNPDNRSEVIPYNDTYDVGMYDIADENSFIRQSLRTLETDQAKAETLRSAPLQIKTLMYYNNNQNKINPTFINVSDDLSMTQNYCYFMYRTQVINRIEVLTGYEVNDGEVFLTKPKWRVIKEPDSDNRLQGINGLTVCRSMPYTNETLKITRNENFNLPTYDEYFIIGGPRTSFEFAADIQGAGPVRADGQSNSGTAAIPANIRDLSNRSLPPPESAEFAGNATGGANAAPTTSRDLRNRRISTPQVQRYDGGES